ncbi:MAG TPA: alpha/beta hydrolase-fold protein [Polyangia bacterium]|nr:alpha/beta hydrolase-fold protein [Polyangia bacterium]
MHTRSATRGLAAVMALGLLGACASGASSDGGAGGGGHDGGSTGSGGSPATGGTIGNGGSTGAGGDTSGGGGNVATGGTTGSGGSTGGAGGMMGSGGATNVGGAGGAAAGGVTGGGGTPGLTDPGTDGDGDFTLPMGHPADALNNEMGSPKGHIITFVMKSSDSKIYPGRNGAYMRNVWVYVPKQYVPGTPAPFITVQDGGFLVWLGTNAPHTPDSGTAAILPGTTNLPRVLDNLIAMGKLPKIVALFVDNGGGDAEGSERGLEYDTVSGKYAEFVDGEVLPRAVSEVKSQLGIDLAFTTDPQGRATLGGSSGGAAAFSMAWWHPELFGRAMIFSGTFVRQASPEDPLYPHGCWSYHDYDPYDATTPNGLVMKLATAKPIRVWIEAAQNDSGAGGGPTSYRDFRLAGQRMAASFKARGYHYHFDYAMGAGHFDGGVIGQTMPAALEWLWRGYPVN